MTEDTPNSKKRMEEIREGTTEDDALQQVINFIRNGWPDEKNALRKFAAEWSIDHVKSSPRYPQSNGKAENAVKTCQMLMKKAAEGQNDFYMALIDWRNTPSADVGLSPAQRLFGRTIRSLMPTRDVLLGPEPLGVDVMKKLELSKMKQAEIYNKSSRPLPPLSEGDTVRMRLPGDKMWTKGSVIQEVGKRSYQVRVKGRIFCRNRKRLIGTGEEPPSHDDDESS
jgi:hypothetical protein